MIIIMYKCYDNKAKVNFFVKLHYKLNTFSDNNIL